MALTITSRPITQLFRAEKDKEAKYIKAWEISWYASMGYTIYQELPKEMLIANANEPEIRYVKIYPNTIPANGYKEEVV